MFLCWRCQASIHILSRNIYSLTLFVGWSIPKESVWESVQEYSHLPPKLQYMPIMCGELKNLPARGLLGDFSYVFCRTNVFSLSYTRSSLFLESRVPVSPTFLKILGTCSSALRADLLICLYLSLSCTQQVKPNLAGKEINKTYFLIL